MPLRDESQWKSTSASYEGIQDLRRTCTEPDDSERMLAFALGSSPRAGNESLVRMLNSNVMQTILLCEVTVGPTRHHTSLRAALASGAAACATVVRVNLEVKTSSPKP